MKNLISIFILLLFYFPNLTYANSMSCLAKAYFVNPIAKFLDLLKGNDVEKEPAKEVKIEESQITPVPPQTSKQVDYYKLKLEGEAKRAYDALRSEYQLIKISKDIEDPVHQTIISIFSKDITAVEIKTARDTIQEASDGDLNENGGNHEGRSSIAIKIIHSDGSLSYIISKKIRTGPYDYMLGGLDMRKPFLAVFQTDGNAQSWTTGSAMASVDGKFEGQSTGLPRENIEKEIKALGFGL